MHLMIFDPHEQGHYLTHVRYLVQGAAWVGNVTLVLREGVTESEPYREQLRSHADAFEVSQTVRPGSFGNGKQLLEDFANACGQHKPDHVWVPSAELLVQHSSVAHILKRFRLPADIQIEGGLVEFRYHRPPRRFRGHVRHILNRTLLRAGPWSALHTIDPTVFTWAQERGGLLAKRVSLVPDPLDEFAPISRESARQVLGIPSTGRYVGAVGSHAITRKGSDLLLEAFSRANLASTDRLLLAGPLGPTLRHRIQTEHADLRRSERLVLLDRYLSERELMNALAAMDLVCTPYIDHVHPSGIVLRAAQAGRPVLAPHQGWFADMIPRFELGEVGDILEVNALATAIERQIERSESFRPSQACRRLVEYSSASNFARLWGLRIRQRMGKPIDAGVRGWDWVLHGSEGT